MQRFMGPAGRAKRENQVCLEQQNLPELSCISGTTHSAEKLLKLTLLWGKLPAAPPPGKHTLVVVKKKLKEKREHTNLRF